MAMRRDDALGGAVERAAVVAPRQARARAVLHRLAPLAAWRVVDAAEHRVLGQVCGCCGDAADGASPSGVSRSPMGYRSMVIVVMVVRLQN